MDQGIVLSVIIPVYNGERYLQRMVTMLEKQTFQNFEVLFIDDGSTDNTYQLCRQYAKNNPHINVIHVENQGVSHARNIGIEAAQGEWIQFIDVDDIIHQNMFLAFRENLEELGGDLAVCGCIRRNVEINEDTLCGPEENALVCKKDIIQLFQRMKMEQRYWILDYIWNKWYKKEVIERYHIRFTEELSLGEDFVFNTQYFQHISSFVMISKFLYKYEVHTDGLASRFQERPWEGRKILFDKQKELYRAMGILESSISEIRRQYGQIFWGDIRRINNINCHFNMKQRVVFIRKMVNSQMFDMILDYLNAKREKKFKIYRAIMKTKNVFIIYCAIRLENFLLHSLYQAIA